MEAVEYVHHFNYVRISGEPFPILQLRICNPSRPDLGLDVDAYLDTGAQASLFNGWRAPPLGLDLLAGRRRSYQFTSGLSIEARLHPVRLSHPFLGDFSLDVGFSTLEIIGFSTLEIRREVLGRDFLNLIQIGFRERHLAFYITPRP